MSWLAKDLNEGTNNGSRSEMNENRILQAEEEREGQGRFYLDITEIDQSLTCITLISFIIAIIKKPISIGI